MLTGGQDVAVDFEMEMIGRAVVHDSNCFIGEPLVVIAVRLGDRQLGRFVLGQLGVSLRNGGDFDIAESTERFDMRGANESGADDGCLNFLHGVGRLRGCAEEIFTTKDTEQHRE